MRYIPGVIVKKTDTILFLVVTYTVTGHLEHEDVSESMMSIAVLTQHSLCDGVRASAERNRLLVKVICFVAKRVLKTSRFSECLEKNLRLGRRC